MKFKICGVGRDEFVDVISDSNSSNSSKYAMCKDVYTLEQIVEMSNGSKAVIILPENFNWEYNTGVLVMRQCKEDNK